MDDSTKDTPFSVILQSVAVISCVSQNQPFISFVVDTTASSLITLRFLSSTFGRYTLFLPWLLRNLRRAKRRRQVWLPLGVGDLRLISTTNQAAGCRKDGEKQEKNHEKKLMMAGLKERKKKRMPKRRPF